MFPCLFLILDSLHWYLCICLSGLLSRLYMFTSAGKYFQQSLQLVGPRHLAASVGMQGLLLGSVVGQGHCPCSEVRGMPLARLHS